MDTINFFKHYFRNAPDGKINLRFLITEKDKTFAGNKDVQEVFVPINDVDRIEEWINTYSNRFNCFFCGSLRKADDGSKDSIYRMCSVWLDHDDITPEIQVKLEQFPLKPSFTVQTSLPTNKQFHWILKEPAPKEEMGRLENVLRRIIAYFDGDPAAKDASRILRIPFTPNFKSKYEETPTAGLIDHNDNEYELEDFERLLPEVETSSTPDQEFDKETGKRLFRIMTCEFLKHCNKECAILPEPQWYAMTTILGRVPGGLDVIHEISRDYPGYSKKETEEKVLHALNDSGPMTCKKIKELWDCGKECIVSSPIGLERLKSLDGEETKEEAPKSKAGLTLISADDILLSNIPEPEWLWDGLLVKNGLSLIIAKPKVGKSIFTFNLAVCVSKGWRLLGRNTFKGPVAYVALEENKAEVKKHLSDILGNDASLPDLYFHFGAVPEKLRAVATSIKEKGLVLVIIDIFQKFFKVKDISEYAEITIALEPVMQIARETGCHIALNHHGKKGLDLDTGDSVLGSTGLLGGVDTLIHIRRNGEQRNRIYTSLQRSSYGKDLENLIVGLDKDGISLVELGLKGEIDLKNCMQEILETLKDGKGQDISLVERDIYGKVNRRRSIVLAGLKRLFDDGKIIRVGKGAKGDPYIYAKSESVILREAREEQEKLIKKGLEKEQMKQKTREARESARKAQNAVPGCLENEKSPEQQMPSNSVAV